MAARSLLVALFACGMRLAAQDWDIPAVLNNDLARVTGDRFHFTFEFRGRYEVHTGNGFGRTVDIATGLYRTRIGAVWTPLKWLRFSGMMQDARAPWYGPNAPNTVRDPADLHEAYVEIAPRPASGFGLTAGRMMLHYGDDRLIGSPQWSNLSRTYDNARVYWRARHLRLEALAVSPVKIRTDGFNHPVLGERIWGTYNTVSDFFRKNLLDFYVLHHYQNRPGGFTGTGYLSTTTGGIRLNGPLVGGLKYSLEGALQGGTIGVADHHAAAAFASISHRWTLGGNPLDVSAEYKYASGTSNPVDPHRSGTFDQLSPANHDKFGHEDLFGWRNLHQFRSLSTLRVRKAWTINFMYDDLWLVCLKDGIYNSAGSLIVRSATGTAGRHVGRETDVFGTYQRGHFLFGAGYAHFFAGEFVHATTPGVGPAYVYVFHTYSL